MQTQPLSPHGAEATAEQQGLHGEESPKKRTMMGKVKDKARKLKTKIKKPKSPGAADNDDSSSASSSEEESGSEPNQQVGGHGGERDIVSRPGPQGEALDAIPDSHVSGAPAGTAATVEQRFGGMSLGDKPYETKLQEEVPSATGVTPYLASHNLGESEGKNVEGKDLVTPISADSQAMDYEKTPEVSKNSDNSAAGYTPTSEEKPSKDHVSEGVLGTAAAGAAALGVKSLSDDSESAGNRDTNVPVEKKSMLEQAKERIFGSSKKVEGEKLQASESGKPAITERATDTATGLKDTIAGKIGYGSKKNLTGDDSTASHDPANKSFLQKAQETAAGATGAVTSKVGYGDKPSEGVGEEVGSPTGENKSYTQKAYDAAYGAKDAVAAKLGYGGTASPTSPTVEGEQKTYLQKVQESAVGAKDVMASKLGYANRELRASTEGAYTDEQNVPAGTAARFHPGEEDRALSQLITEKMSTGASTVKDTLLRPFGSKSGPPTPTTTPPPSSASAFADDPVHNTVTGTNDALETAPYAAGEEKPGIVGKMTGAVSSLLGKSGSGKKRVDETSGKANEDSQTAGVEMR